MHRVERPAQLQDNFHNKKQALKADRRYTEAAKAEMIRELRDQTNAELRKLAEEHQAAKAERRESVERKLFSPVQGGGYLPPSERVALDASRPRSRARPVVCTTTCS